MTAFLLLAASLAVLFLPGLALGWCLRLRGLLLVAWAPVGTFAQLAVAGMWLRPAGVPWEPITAIAATAVACAAAWALTGRRPGEVRLPAGPRWALAGPVAGSAIALVVVGAGTGWDLDAVNQTWDTPWHGNLTALIATTGLGDWTASRGNQVGWDGQFYPAALHVVEAVVVDVTGQGAVRVFAVFFALSSVLLPWSLFVLVRTIAPTWHVAAAATGLLAVVPPDNPWVTQGTQAWAWAMAAVPVVVALLVLLARQRTSLVLVPAALALAGSAALQPAGAASAIVLAASWLLVAPTSMRVRVGVTRWWLVAAAGAAALLGPLLVAGQRAVESVATFPSPPDEPLARSVVQALVPHAPVLGDDVMVVVAVCAWAGLVAAALVRELRWLVLAWVATGGLLLVSLSAPPDLRPYLIGLWYNDDARLARLHSMTTLLLAGIGVGGLSATASRLPRAAVRRATTGLSALALVAGLAVERQALQTDLDLVQSAYGEHQHGPSITAQQVEVLRAAAPLFGPDEVVVVDPWQGAVWLYALTGVRSVQGRYGDPDPRSEVDTLLRRLNEVENDPEVARLVVERRVCGVYVGTGSVVPKGWSWSGFAGLADGTVPAFRQVYSDAASQLYLLTGPLAEQAGCRSAGRAVDLPDRIG